MKDRVRLKVVWRTGSLVGIRERVLLKVVWRWFDVVWRVGSPVGNREHIHRNILRLAIIDGKCEIS